MTDGRFGRGADVTVITGGTWIGRQARQKQTVPSTDGEVPDTSQQLTDSSSWQSDSDGLGVRCCSNKLSYVFKSSVMGYSPVSVLMICQYRCLESSRVIVHRSCLPMARVGPDVASPRLAVVRHTPKYRTSGAS